MPRASFVDFLGGSDTLGVDTTGSKDPLPDLQIPLPRRDRKLVSDPGRELRPAGEAPLETQPRGSAPLETVQPQEEVIEYWTVEEGSAGPAGGHGAVIVHSGHEHHNVRHTHEVVEHGDHRAGKAGAAERRAGHPAERPGQQRHHAEPDGGAGETEPGDGLRHRPGGPRPGPGPAEDPPLQPHIIFEYQDQGMQPGIILGGVIAIFAQVYLWGNVFVTIFKPQRQPLQAQGAPSAASDAGIPNASRSNGAPLPGSPSTTSGPDSSGMPNRDASNAIAVA